MSSNSSSRERGTTTFDGEFSEIGKIEENAFSRDKSVVGVAVFSRFEGDAKVPVGVTVCDDGAVLELSDFEGRAPPEDTTGRTVSPDGKDGSSAEESIFLFLLPRERELENNVNCDNK